MTVSRSTTTEPVRPRPWLAPLLLVLQLGAVACAGDNLLLPSAGQPAKISVFSGNHQAGTVGQPLGDSLVVLVTDPEDRPVQGVEVAFVAPAGAGVQPNDTIVTGADGRAAVRYTLSTTAGDQIVVAQAKSAGSSSATLSTTFTAAAAPENAVALALAGGNSQRGDVGTVLPESLAVRAADRFGNGVPGIEVTWEAAGGSVSPQSVVTGADGRSAVQRTLGDRPGSYATTAAASGLDGSPISFTSIASAPALVLVTQPSSTASAGLPFAQQPVLQLEDAAGAPLARADVTVTAQIATGSGSLGGRTTAKSDAQGRVAFSDLSIRGAPGERTLIFAANEFTSAVSTPVAVSPGPPAAAQSSASVLNGTVGIPTAISIRLKDEFGTSVGGAATAIAVTVSGANPATGLMVTDLGGGSYSASYTPVRSGTDQIDVRVNGNPVAGSPLTSTVAPGPASPVTTTAAVTRSGFFIYTISIVVTTRDAQGNVLGRGGDQVQDQPSGGSVRNLIDNGDGTYSDSFVTFNATASIAITLNGVAIAGSPFQPQ